MPLAVIPLPRYLQQNPSPQPYLGAIMSLFFIHWVHKIFLQKLPYLLPLYFFICNSFSLLWWWKWDPWGMGHSFPWKSLKLPIFVVLPKHFTSACPCCAQILNRKQSKRGKMIDFDSVWGKVRPDEDMAAGAGGSCVHSQEAGWGNAPAQESCFLFLLESQPMDGITFTPRFHLRILLTDLPRAV